MEALCILQQAKGLCLRFECLFQAASQCANGVVAQTPLETHIADPWVWVAVMPEACSLRRGTTNWPKYDGAIRLPGSLFRLVQRGNIWFVERCDKRKWGRRQPQLLPCISVWMKGAVRPARAANVGGGQPTADKPLLLSDGGSYCLVSDLAEFRGRNGLVLKTSSVPLANTAICPNSLD